MRARSRRERRESSSSSLTPDAETPDLGFVACIERGVLESQTLLLFESIRRYAGRYRACALYAVSPRAGHAVSDATRRKLDELGATHSDVTLNTECTEYGPANRIAAAAYVEEHCPHDTLVVLDSDTLFLREPSEFALPSDVDVAARPVDLKGMATEGPSDAFDRYWRDLCRCCGVDYDEHPWGETFIDRRRIKADYNSGLTVVRGRLGVMRRCADFFFRSVRDGLKPRTDAPPSRTGAGWIDRAANNFWGSSQAALSLAIWTTTRRVRELPPTYNYPLHLHEHVNPALARQTFPQLVHVHYHWLLAPDMLASNPLFLPHGPLSAEQRRWLRAATPVA